jgi:ribonuclease HII
LNYDDETNMAITHTPLQKFLQPNRIEAGCDEAGRGCLAGPVFAAAVILPNHFDCPQLNDSKQLSEKQRQQLRTIIEQNALTFAVEICTPDEIDEINILWASVKAMHRALAKLTTTPDHILVDGNRFRPFNDIPHTCVVKGDSKFLAIAAASVLAKTYSDDYMSQLHNDFPEYDWAKNKGYPTKTHREAIKNHGVTKHHRRSFNLMDRQLEIVF